MITTQSTRRPLGLIVLAALTTVLVLGRLPPVSGGETGIKLKPDDRRVVGRGKALYAEHCASCHGAELKGEPGWPDWRNRKANGRLSAPPHDGSGHTWHHDDATLFKVTKYGPAKFLDDPGYASDMPGYEDLLHDEDIVAVLSFIKSTWTGAARKFNDRVNDPSQKLQ